MLFVTSTYGDGEPPDSAKQFWDFLNSPLAQQLAATRFSVCALGDTNYAKFCQFGKDLDARLKALRAKCVHPIALCDTDYEAPFSEWTGGALNALREGVPVPVSFRKAPASQDAETDSRNERPAPGFDRNRPLPGQLITNRRLNSVNSEKDVRHLEIALGDSQVVYEAGDALGVYPRNCPQLVEEILAALKATGAELVDGRGDAPVTLREALLTHYEIAKVPPSLLRFIAVRSRDTTLERLLAPEANGELAKYMWGRDIVDVVTEHPGVTFAPTEFVALLIEPRIIG